MFKELREYLKDNPEGYWFKRRPYGWGWIPARWQGWAILFAYIALVTLAAFSIDGRSLEREIVFTFILPVVFLTLALIRICYKTGEEPRWQWGFPDKP